MAEKLSSNFFGCVNPCNIEWQKFLNDQTKLDKGNVIEKWFLNDMGECEECKAKFSLFRRKRLCCECGLAYCGSCLTRNNGRQRQCNKCTILSRWPVNIDEISSLRVRDLRHFLNSQKIKTDTIREKKDLVDLVAYHLKYRRGAVPPRRSQDFQSENNISSTRPSNNAPRPSVLRDDGIRVRPLNTINTEGDSSGYSGVASSSTNCESSGIRVFASSNNQNPSEVAENQDSSDDTSSDWSFLLSDIGPERSPADSSSVTPNTESEASVSHSNNLTDNRSASGVDEDSNNLTDNRRASGVEDVNIYPNLEDLENIPGENPENMQTEDSENPQIEEPESSQNENHENNQNENLEHIYSEMIQNDPPRNQPSPSINLVLAPVSCLEQDMSFLSKSIRARQSVGGIIIDHYYKIEKTVASDVIKLSSIDNEESIKNLTVRQCKEILSLNRVDYSGVWEKHELVSKVQMLWRDYKQREEIKDVNDEQLCKICMDAVMDCVFLECGHIVSCTDCGKQMSECPVCRQNVIRVVKTFRA